MTRAQFLDILRRRLAGLPSSEIDELVGDYAAHFDEGMAEGRNEEEIAEALGDPLRLARELRAEAGFRRWEEARTPTNFFAVLFGLLALVTVDFVFLLPLLGGFALFILIAGIVQVALCIAGLVMVAKLFQFDHGLGLHYFARILGGLGLMSLGVGGSALLILIVDWVVRALGKFARLHYTLLNKADQAA
ncbi:MAG TPA: DUF1700 domain-containing protein [Reyranella sp.]|jgi:uncharacterized membrane protein|nr:DUF1700 domain-containing protein [Reyranella sp.]